MRYHVTLNVIQKVSYLRYEASIIISGILSPLARLSGRVRYDESIPSSQWRTAFLGITFSECSLFFLHESKSEESTECLVVGIINRFGYSRVAVSMNFYIAAI